MEEVWLNRWPGDENSVHLQDFPVTPGDWRDDALAEKWAGIRRVRRVVTGALEIERAEKRIGASLEAAPVVYIAGAGVRDLVQSTDFADLCITSGITISGDATPADAFTLPDIEGVAIVPVKSSGEKCQRCWKILPEVGSQGDPHLCGRRNDAVSG